MTSLVLSSTWHHLNFNRGSSRRPQNVFVKIYILQRCTQLFPSSIDVRSSPRKRLSPSPVTISQTWFWRIQTSWIFNHVREDQDLRQFFSACHYSLLQPYTHCRWYLQAMFTLALWLYQTLTEWCHALILDCWSSEALTSKLRFGILYFWAMFWGANRRQHAGNPQEGQPIVQGKGRRDISSYLKRALANRLAFCPPLRDQHWLTRELILR